MNSSTCMKMAMMAAVAGLACSSASAHDMMYVGQNSAGKLTIFIDPFMMPNMMVQSPYVEFDGWLQTELGMETIGEPVPEYNLYPISPLSDIRLKLVGADAGIVLQQDGFAGPLAIGDSYYLGNPYFHHHPIWNITEPEIGKLYRLTFVLHDLTGMYPDSAPFTITFGCTPCPADFDQSTFVDIEDFISFVMAFEAGDESADVDQSGFVDTDDFDRFVEVFEAGC
jgi:hypothetical protein